MAAATRIRGQEVTIQLIVDGDLQNGSFAKCESFKHTPDSDIPKHDFLGETESEGDFQHHGHNFNFSIHQEDSKALTLLQTLITNNEQGLPHPQVTVVAIYRYRDPSLSPVTKVFEGCVIKMDDEDVGGRKDYVKNAFSGFAKTVSVLK